MLLIAMGIALYWYWVFGLSDNPMRRRGPDSMPMAARPTPPPPVAAPVEAPPVTPQDELRDAIVRGARAQVGRSIRWDADYVAMTYPGGDVPSSQGTGVDILIRALRAARVDLQVLVHLDRSRHPEHYPLHLFPESGTEADPSIDHRRIENVWVFFNRHAARLDAGVSERSLKEYLPGDIVFWGEGRMEAPVHVGIVASERDDRGVPLVIELSREEGRVMADKPLTYRPLMGHYRLDPDRLDAVETPRPANTD